MEQYQRLRALPPARFFPLGETWMGAALIVAHDGVTAERLAGFLQERGYLPTILPEGKAAHHWVRQHRPDLVFLDLELPDLNSSKICETFKLDQETNLIPVILLTPAGE